MTDDLGLDQSSASGSAVRRLRSNNNGDADEASTSRKKQRKQRPCYSCEGEWDGTLERAGLG